MAALQVDLIGLAGSSDWLSFILLLQFRKNPFLRLASGAFIYWTSVPANSRLQFHLANSHRLAPDERPPTLPNLTDPCSVLVPTHSARWLMDHFLIGILAVINCSVWSKLLTSPFLTAIFPGPGFAHHQPKQSAIFLKRRGNRDTEE
jgi:hypothetical protein